MVNRSVYSLTLRGKKSEKQDYSFGGLLQAGCTAIGNCFGCLCLHVCALVCVLHRTVDAWLWIFSSASLFDLHEKLCWSLSGLVLAQLASCLGAKELALEFSCLRIFPALLGDKL